MAYTLWHSGIVIGTSELDRPGNPRQWAGIFHPTAYGLEIFPRLTGILSAGHELKKHLDAKGLSVEEIEPGEIEELMVTSSGGRKIIDLGRMLSEIELRAPDGSGVEFASIAFSDLLELQRLTRDMRLDCADNLRDLPPDAPRYIVSATFRSDKRRTTRGARAWRRPWSNNN